MPKIANVKLMAQPSDTAKSLCRLYPAGEELVVVGGEKGRRYVNAQGPTGPDGLKVVLMTEVVKRVPGSAPRTPRRNAMGEPGDWRFRLGTLVLPAAAPSPIKRLMRFRLLLQVSETSQEGVSSPP